MSDNESDTISVLARLRGAGSRAMSNALHPQTLILGCAGAVLAAYTGPFGTYQREGFLLLLGIWLVLLSLAIVTAYFVSELINVLLSDWSEEARVGTFLIVGSLIIGGLVFLLLTYVLAADKPSKPGFLELSVYSFGVMSVIIIVRTIRPGVQTALDERGSAPAGLRPVEHTSRLARRLDLEEGARIDLISADGHFIEVHTSHAKVRVRMRFSDAVAELDGTVGLTVHRSHWVRKDAVLGWTPDAKKPYIVLENEQQVPVSKTYFERVRGAGFPQIALASES